MAPTTYDLTVSPIDLNMRLVCVLCLEKGHLSGLIIVFEKSDDEALLCAHSLGQQVLLD